MPHVKTDEVVKLKQLFNNAFSNTILYDIADKNYTESLNNAYRVINSHSKKKKINDTINRFGKCDSLGNNNKCALNCCVNNKIINNNLVVDDDKYLDVIDEQLVCEILTNFNRYSLLNYTKLMASRTNAIAINYNNFFLNKNKFKT